MRLLCTAAFLIASVYSAPIDPSTTWYFHDVRLADNPDHAVNSWIVGEFGVTQSVNIRDAGQLVCRYSGQTSIGFLLLPNADRTV